jgi:hypothetical protein
MTTLTAEAALHDLQIKTRLRSTSQANDSRSKAFEGSCYQSILSHNSIFKEQSKQPNAVQKKNPSRKLLNSGLPLPS